MSAIVFSSLLAFFAYERLDPRPISLSVNGPWATFSFRDALYAAEFERLNGEHQAASDALEAWNQRRAPMLHVGDIHSDRPQARPAGGGALTAQWREDQARMSRTTRPWTSVSRKSRPE